MVTLIDPQLANLVNPTKENADLSGHSGSSKAPPYSGSQKPCCFLKILL